MNLGRQPMISPDFFDNSEENNFSSHHILYCKDSRVALRSPHHTLGFTILSSWGHPSSPLHLKSRITISFNDLQLHLILAFPWSGQGPSLAWRGLWNFFRCLRQMTAVVLCPFATDIFVTKKNRHWKMRLTLALLPSACHWQPYFLLCGSSRLKTSEELKSHCRDSGGFLLFCSCPSSFVSPRFLFRLGLLCCQHFWDLLFCWDRVHVVQAGFELPIFLPVPSPAFWVLPCAQSLCYYPPQPAWPFSYWAFKKHFGVGFD